jgi:hypothetical protein
LVDLFEYMMMHGLTNPKFKQTNIVPVHTIQGAGVLFQSLILNLSTKRRCVIIFTFWPLYPQERKPTPIEKAGWVPEPVWMFWRREKCLAPARIQDSNPGSSSP